MEKDNRGKLTLGVAAGSNSFYGDYTAGEIRPKTSFLVGTSLTNHLYLDANLGYRGLMVKKKVDDYSYFSDLSLRYVFLPYDKISPYLSIGGGFDYRYPGVGLSGDEFFPKLNGRIGMEFMAKKKLGITISSEWDYYLSDQFDGTRNGRYNDMGWGISLGMKFYFFKLKQKVAYF